MENDMPGGMAGAVIHIECKIADRHCIAIFQPAIRLKTFRMHPIFAAIIAELRDPETILFMRAFNGHAELLGKNSRLATMIEVPMGEKDFLNRHTVLRSGGFQLIEIAARIRKGSAHRFGAPDQAAILLQRRHRNDRGFHGHCFGHAAHVALPAPICNDLALLSQGNQAEAWQAFLGLPYRRHKPCNISNIPNGFLICPKIAV